MDPTLPDMLGLIREHVGGEEVDWQQLLEFERAVVVYDDSSVAAIGEGGGGGGDMMGHRLPTPEDAPSSPPGGVPGLIEDDGDEDLPEDLPDIVEIEDDEVLVEFVEYDEDLPPAKRSKMQSCSSNNAPVRQPTQRLNSAPYQTLRDKRLARLASAPAVGSRQGSRTISNTGVPPQAPKEMSIAIRPVPFHVDNQKSQQRQEALKPKSKQIEKLARELRYDRLSANDRLEKLGKATELAESLAVALGELTEQLHNELSANDRHGKRGKAIKLAAKQVRCKNELSDALGMLVAVLQHWWPWPGSLHRSPRENAQRDRLTPVLQALRPDIDAAAAELDKRLGRILDPLVASWQYYMTASPHQIKRLWIQKGMRMWKDEGWAVGTGMTEKQVKSEMDTLAKAARKAEAEAAKVEARPKAKPKGRAAKLRYEHAVE